MDALRPGCLSTFVRRGGVGTRRGETRLREVVAGCQGLSKAQRPGGGCRGVASQFGFQRPDNDHADPGMSSGTPYVALRNPEKREPPIVKGSRSGALDTGVIRARNPDERSTKKAPCVQGAPLDEPAIFFSNKARVYGHRVPQVDRKRPPAVNGHHRSPEGGADGMPTLGG